MNRARTKSTPFTEWVRDLPDQVMLAAERGQTVVLPDPGTGHGRTLYASLGVQLELPLTRDGASVEPPAAWFIERLRPGKYFARDLSRWKAMRAEGWDLTVLIDRVRREAVAFGCLKGET